MSDATSQVIVYGAEWCAWCHVVMEYFDKKGVKYEYRDIDSNPAWIKECVEKSGQNGIPVTDLAGDIIVGYDLPKINTSLKAHDLVKS